ncbi:MAG TPA: BREX-3 system P-loop-containing protein BrxF, partial [Bacilli bacterium]|nr:BREX-3 system P-loop-containing protein BrxF [Bacilli bacterium]
KESGVCLGTLIKSSQFSKKMLERTNMAIVLCSSEPRLKKIIAEAGFKELSLNKILAEALVKKDTAIRPQFVADEVMKIVSSIQGPIFLTDYEMLFDPRYSIDVIRLFYELSRRAKIVIKWCGTLDDNHLVYATPAYIDFHSYNIHDYDVTCVI